MILEGTCIREGNIHDLSLDRTFVAGLYACRPPGIPHGPWCSASGCRTLESRYYRQEPRGEVSMDGGVDSNGLSINAFISPEVERPLRSHRLLERESV